MWDHALTYHFYHLQDPEVGLEVLHVAPYPPEHVPGVDGLGGGLVGAAGPGDHGRVGGLAVEALRLLGGPHDGDGFRGGSWTLDGGLLRHIFTDNRAVWRRAHCVPCGLEEEVDGEDEPDSPLFIASFPAGEKTSSRGGCPSSCSRTSSSGKSAWCPCSLRCCLRATYAACLPQTAALATLLGGSLVRVPVSLRPRTVLVKQQQKCLPCVGRCVTGPGQTWRHCGREGRRGSVSVRYCKLDEVGGNQRGPTGSGCLLLLSRSGRGGCGAAGRVCLRPSGNCTFLCRLCAKFQVSANTAPQHGSSRSRHTDGSGSFSRASSHHHLGPDPPVSHQARGNDPLLLQTPYSSRP